MTKKPHRTRPLDRDGNGSDGGSLPGNQTAPLAEVDATSISPVSQLFFALRDLGFAVEGDGALSPETVNGWTDEQRSDLAAWVVAASATPPTEQRPPVPELLASITVAPAPVAAGLDLSAEADAAADAGDEPDPWNRDDLYVADLLVSNGVANLPPSPAAIVGVITSWSDEDARAVESWAEDSLLVAPGAAAPAPEIVAYTFPPVVIRPAETLTDPAAAAIDTFQGDGGDTFTAEEVEASATADDDDDDDDADFVTNHGEGDPFEGDDVGGGGEQIAVRLAQLEVLSSARWLYLSEQGYSETYGAPYIDAATVAGWIKAGLAIDCPTAGIRGGVKPAPEARALVAELRQHLAQAEAA